MEILYFNTLAEVCEKLKVPVSPLRMAEYLEGCDEPKKPQEPQWVQKEEYYDIESFDSFEEFHNYSKSFMKLIESKYKYIRNIGYYYDYCVSFEYTSTPPVTESVKEQYKRNKRAYIICKECAEKVKTAYENECKIKGLGE